MPRQPIRRLTKRAPGRILSDQQLCAFLERSKGISETKGAPFWRLHAVAARPRCVCPTLGGHES
jgi:hypothetical protein